MGSSWDRGKDKARSDGKASSPAANKENLPQVERHKAEPNLPFSLAPQFKKMKARRVPPAIKKSKPEPRFELGSADSESNVLTVTPFRR